MLTKRDFGIIEMTQFQKLNERFLAKPKDFTFIEMKKLLEGLGYREIQTGKTSGSRAAFIHKNTRHIIRLHRPHPQPNMKRYQLDFVEEELKLRGLLK